MDEPLIAARLLKRHGCWNRGEVISLPIAQARQLDAMRVIEPLHIMVPPGAETALGASPARQPAQVVRK